MPLLVGESIPVSCAQSALHCRLVNACWTAKQQLPFGALRSASQDRLSALVESRQRMFYMADLVLRSEMRCEVAALRCAAPCCAAHALHCALDALVFRLSFPACSPAAEMRLPRAIRCCTSARH